MGITRLQLENWRNFTAVNVALQRRVFLFGPNASGKSNFLDVLRFLHDIVAVGGGFQEAVRRRGGVSKLWSLAARRQPEILIAISVGTADEPGTWNYSIRFTQDNRQRPVLRSETVKRSGVLIIERPDQQDDQDPERLTQTYLEQVNANQEFRSLFAAGTIYVTDGKAELLRRLPGYNKAANCQPWLVVVDLDDDGDCAPQFCRRWLQFPATAMCFRVAVHAGEAWLLADAEQVARFLHIRSLRFLRHQKRLRTLSEPSSTWQRNLGAKLLLTTWCLGQIVAAASDPHIPLA